MTTKEKKKQTGRKPHRDLYRQVTDKIVVELEQGRFPWVQPWDSGYAVCAVGLPRNASTGKHYSGINILILWGAVIGRGFASQNWLTFRQAQTLGGTVRKGEKGETVCYVDRFTPKEEQRKAAESGEEAASIPFLKRYRVFNVSQCDGLPDSVSEIAALLPEREIIPRAEALAMATGAAIRIGGDRAFYHPLADYVQLPPQPAFTEQINYYRTCFHELGHWTGHRSRLDRDQSGRSRTKAYAHEELVAELCAAFTCASLDIVPTVRHADYLGAWLEVLKEDKRAIFRAASQASKAADFLLAFERKETAAISEREEAA
ncbi:MAG: ArdC family protein [Rhizobiaceae bacterium]